MAASLSLFSILYIFLSVVSTAEIAQFTPAVIVSDSENFPVYSHSPLLKNKHAPASLSRREMEVSNLTPKTTLERLPDDTFYTIIRYLDYKSVAKLCIMSKSLYNTVNLALDTIFKKLSVTECGIRFSRKDHFIMALHLAHLYENSYPGLSKYNITTIDFISLAFVALIVSPENRSEDKTVIESTDASYVELKKIFMELDYIKKNVNVYPGNIFPGIFRSPNLLSMYLFKIVNMAAIPITLETLYWLQERPKLIKNQLYKPKELPLFSVAVSMAVLDQRPFTNMVRSTDPASLVSAPIGCHHLLHALIIRQGTYDSEIFKRPELGQVRIDCETRLPFYSAALLFAIKFRNISVIRGLLADFSPEQFHPFSVHKIDFVQTLPDYNNIFDLLDNSIVSIKKYFMA